MKIHQENTFMKQYHKFVTISLLPASLIFAACGQEDSTPIEEATVAVATAAVTDTTGGTETVGIVVDPSTATEATAAFDGLSNGVSTATDFNTNKDLFEEIELTADGVGPVYNAQSCRECHQNPVTGGASQVTELRAGHFDGTNFINHPGGSLINDRALNSSIQERVLAGNEVRTFRLSLSLLGDGFVEAIDNATLRAISTAQPAAQRGQVITVPILESPGSVRVGRFGWKNQHASLLSFSADAYVNEMGITSSLQPTENTSNGKSVAAFDTVADPEDDGDTDIHAFAAFMRALKVPPRDTVLAATTSATNGSTLFNSMGCAVCHVRSITTAPAGTTINGGTFTVPAALGNKTIHPFGDYLLHDVGTGDGIVQNGGQTTRNKVRTAPLWGLRSRDRLMHDGASVTRSDAIARHKNEGATAAANFAALTAAQKTDVLNFLDSL
ncbi:MAG TPA: di-heme oxidoredictase family protein [Kofleriaceae bacterium]